MHVAAGFCSLTTGAQPHLLLAAPTSGAVGLGMWGGPVVDAERSQAGFWTWKDGTIAWGGGPRSAGPAAFHLQMAPNGGVGFTLRDASGATVWSPLPAVPPKATEAK
jgi:hypothetical protein